MRRKNIRLTACALLSLLLVFGGISVLRRADRQLPHAPFSAAETITAAENTRAESTSATVHSGTTEPAPDEPTRFDADDGNIPNERNTEPITAFSRGSASVLGAQRSDGGVPQLRPDGKRIGTGFDGAEGSASVPATTAPALSAETTTAVPETTTAVPETTTAPQRDMPRSNGEPATAAHTTEPVTKSKPVTVPHSEPVSKAEEPTTEEEKQELKIATNLTNHQQTQSELAFYAYLEGDTDGCSLLVRLTHEDDGGNGELLQPEEDISYRVVLSLGVHHFTMTIRRDDNTVVSYRDFTIEIVEETATAEKPEVGKEPPVIKTNLDDWTDEIVNNRFTFRVTARTAKGALIPADGVEVQMDGSRIYDPTGSSPLEYVLFFEAPNVGETEKHTVTVLAWDGKGNSAFKSYEIVYRHVSDGDRTGEVTVILDATTVGLGVLDTETIELRQGENAAQILLRVLDDFDYTYDYAGSEQLGFYLRRIGRDGMCDSAKIPDRLWTMILRDGLKTTAQHDRDSLGEHDYTQGAGWMFCVNNTLFPGKGMERTFLDPGDTLRVCFTLSYGKDVGGFDSSGTGMGSLAGYCGIWRDGEYRPLEHQWSESDEHGLVVCTICHERRKAGDNE